MSTPEIEQQASFVESRRDFIIKSAAACGAVLLGGYGVGFGREWVRSNMRENGRDQAVEIFEDGIERSFHKVGVFPGLLQIDPAARVASGMFEETEELSEHHEIPDGFLVAKEPFGVKRTLLRNIADYSQGVQDEVNRILPEMSDGLVAFWLPNEIKLSYLDIKKESGRVVAFSDQNTRAKGVLMNKVEIEGREVRGDYIYPYRQTTGIEFAPPDYVQKELDDLHEAALASEADEAHFDKVASKAAWDAYQAATEKARSYEYNYKGTVAYRVFGRSRVMPSTAHLEGEAAYTHYYREADEIFPAA